MDSSGPLIADCCSCRLCHTFHEENYFAEHLATLVPISSEPLIKLRSDALPLLSLITLVDYHLIFTLLGLYCGLIL